MECPWKINNNVPETTFAEILSEDYAKSLQNKENQRFKAILEQREKQELAETAKLGIVTPESSTIVPNDDTPTTSKDKSNERQEIILKNGEVWEDFTSLLTEQEENEGDTPENSCHDDEVIARMLQSQFDHEYNEEIRRIEQQQNKNKKVTISLDKFRRNGDLEFLEDDDGESDEDDVYQNRDWDRFETNEKKLDTIPKCGFRMDEEGEMVTKHDPHLCGVRNACRVMSFPLHLSTGDGAGFEMSLSNKVYNQLKSYSHRREGKKSKMHNRKENMATAEMGVDARTRLLLYKLINKQLLEQINGIVSTGKEALILHANSDPNYIETDQIRKKGSKRNSDDNETTVEEKPQKVLPKECAIKIFRTTLNEFKQRDRYIKDDFRFKDRFSSQDNFYIINLWAEKEMHNLNRMKAVGINCPEVVTLKKHVLVMSFIGDNHNAAPKLKDARLTDAELSCAYEEIVETMHKLYNKAKLVHADLSEYNILWYNGMCWFIDVAQAVEPEHPSALEFLLRDCGNIVQFFTKRGLSNIFTKEELFQHITSLSADTQVGLLERIHTRGSSIHVATVPSQDDCPDELKPLSYPFDLAWEKSQMERNKNASLIENDGLDTAANAMNVLKIQCSAEAAEELPKQTIEKMSFANVISTGNCPEVTKN